MSAKVERNASLERLVFEVEWDRFRALLSGLWVDGVGRPGFAPLLMVKALLLQQLYALSDAGLEEAINGFVPQVPEPDAGGPVARQPACAAFANGWPGRPAVRRFRAPARPMRPDREARHHDQCLADPDAVPAGLGRWEGAAVDPDAANTACAGQAGAIKAKRSMLASISAAG